MGSSLRIFIWLILQDFKILDLLNNITRTPNFSIVTGPLIKPAQAENQVGEIDSSLSLFSCSKGNILRNLNSSILF